MEFLTENKAESNFNKGQKKINRRSFPEISEMLEWGVVKTIPGSNTIQNRVGTWYLNLHIS
jgi:hypothetical protein